MVEFSRNALEHLLGLGAEIVGVCTLQESKFNTDHVDLSGVSAAHGIPWRYADDINSAEIVHWIRDTAPDVIFCFGWSRLLGLDLLKLAPMGVVGFHPAALPANRGRHPLIWAPSDFIKPLPASSLWTLAPTAVIFSRSARS